ncbi:DUF4116 domain-containing protein [Candidatus Thioglobus sp.]|nr:DUF4116 domain-containing protein [Candidatus Thioglobus sp.]MDB9803326.1 DUF4116 domain-containing protein [Candidatus Thioglobus sp.]
MPNNTTAEINLKMTGMWVGKPDQNPEDAYYNCRYLIVWAELSSNEMAGVVCGYSGGGQFEMEDFYAQHSDNELTSLFIDLWDKVTGEVYDSFTPPTTSAIGDVFAAASEEIYRWNDQDRWIEIDTIALRPERIQDLRDECGNTFLLRRNSHALVNSILEYAGITAWPTGIVDREELLEAVKLECGYYPLNPRPDWEALKHADDSFQADHEVVLAAVRNSGTSLKYASKALKDDREVVLEAVRNNGIALKYASDTLKADHEVVLEALQNNGNALRLASNELQNAPELKKYCSNITIDSKSFREDDGTEDYYQSKLDLNRYVDDAAYLVEWFIDNLGDALQYQDMKKGESKEVGTVTVLCVDRNLKVDTSDEDWIEAKGDILIMLTYDECPDDTIKIRFKIEAFIDDDRLEIQDQSIYYLDSEGQENPLNYSNFLELFQILKDLVYN